MTSRGAEYDAATKTQRTSIGSVIGRLDTISPHGRREADLWQERTNARVTVTFTDDQTVHVTAALGKRVEVAGPVIRDSEDRPVSVRMRSLDLLFDAPVSELVGLDPNFTGGLEPALYLRELRGES